MKKKRLPDSSGLYVEMARHLKEKYPEIPDELYPTIWEGISSFREPRSGFREWHKQTEKSPDFIEALTKVDDELKNRITGHAPESPKSAKSATAHLKYWLLKACYKAKEFKDRHQATRRQYKDAVADISDKGRNPLKAIKDLRDFIKHHPEPAGFVMADLIARLADAGIYVSLKEEQDATVTLDAILDAIAAGLKRYPPQWCGHWTYAGALIYPEPISREHKDDVTDSLIFELAFLIRRAVADKPQPRWLAGMPLPPGTRLKAQNEVIAAFVNATLRRSIDEGFVKSRIDELTKKGVLLGTWR